MARSILVVDDERTLRETLAEGLEEEGFAVFQAADGREAVEAFRRHHPDLILLDLMLPELSGTEVCRIIRAESGVPILMLTAKSAEIDKVVGLELGADDYVTKPFSFRELLARVRACCAAPKRRPRRRNRRRSIWGLSKSTWPDGGSCGTARPCRSSPRLSICLSSCSGTPATSSPVTSCWSASGATTTPGRRAPSMSTSTGCAPRSRPTQRIRCTWKRFAASVTS